MNKLMDNVLARASIAGQHINAYTGTDYSGIENIRKDIISQEEQVKTYLKAVDTAKTSQHDEMSKQTSSQKEIVSLLERKASWSPSDLERYMALVRSEHLNEQATQAAKDNLATAERELEDARAFMERLERKQYHEEQVWSDTIRRNSTWVTFGLMGVNIVLLLANILLFEPYRRRKIVRDVKAALDEKTLVPIVAGSPKESDIDVAPVIETQREAVEEIAQPPDSIFADKEEIGQKTLAAGEALPQEALHVADTATIVAEKSISLSKPQASWEEYLRAHTQAYIATFRGCFSDRTVAMKQVDVTTIALQGAAAGATTVGLIFMLLRSK